MYRITIEDTDIGLLATILEATAGGCIDLVHNDPEAPETPDGVVVSSVTDGLITARFADSGSGEAYGPEFIVGLRHVEKVAVW